MALYVWGIKTGNMLATLCHLMSGPETGRNRPTNKIDSSKQAMHPSIYLYLLACHGGGSTILRHIANILL
jgi:hypothetical protein